VTQARRVSDLAPIKASRSCFRFPMSPLKVLVKHAGKTHELYLDSDQPPAAFKEVIYQATGVPVDRMKVMAKGTVLKVCEIIYICDRRANVCNRMIPPGRRFRPKRCGCYATLHGHQNDDIINRGKPSRSLVRLENYLNHQRNAPSS
jgi:hypothetical protein